MSEVNDKIDEMTAIQRTESSAVAVLSTTVEALITAVLAFIAANSGAVNVAELQTAIDEAKSSVATLGSVQSEVEAAEAQVPTTPAVSTPPAPVEPQPPSGS